MTRKIRFIAIMALLGILLSSSLAGAHEFEEIPDSELAIYHGEGQFNVISDQAFENAQGISIVTQVSGDGVTVNNSVTVNIFYFDDVCFGDITFSDDTFSFAFPVE